MSKTNQKQSSNASQFPVGKQASRQARQALFSSKNPIETISNFQQTHSLHSFISRAFGTTSIYSLPNKKGTGVGGTNGGRRLTRGDVELKQSREEQGVMIEPLEPESVLTFLNHLGVSRYEIHKKIGDTLRAKLESEIQKVDLKSPHGKEKLLELLKSAWEYIHVPELRPVFVTLIKKLGEDTPVEVLVLLAKKEAAKASASLSSSSLSSPSPKAQPSEEMNLKYGELLNQFGVPMKRLVWEADWASVVRGDGQLVTETTTSSSDTVGTLNSNNILCDMVRPIVNDYVTDAQLVHAADFSFPLSIRDKKMDTMKRRTISAHSTATAVSTSVLTGTLSSLTAQTMKKHNKGEKTTDNNNKTSVSSTSTKEQLDSNTNTAGLALAKLKEVMGSRPKLLSAVLNMLIAEHGLRYSKSKHRPSIIGGASYLHCTLVADIILSYGHLPKQYESVQVLAKILDNSVKKGLVSDQAIAQIQGCLRAIFQSASDKDVDKKPTITVPQKNETSNERTAATERQFEIKLLRKIIKLAVARMNENDSQRCFLNPVTDDIAPGYSSLIKQPICLSEIEKKAIDLQYSSLSKFEKDVQLMFSNCIRYNTGPQGQWFRGEARRQQKKWKESIMKNAKEMYTVEMSKRKNGVGENESTPSKKKVIDEAERIRAQQQSLSKKLAAGGKSGEKRKVQSISQDNNDHSITSLSAEDVEPLPESRNKRKKTNVEVTSMPALASMLLSDPFVVRLLIFKIINAMKNDIIKSNDVPANHKTIPSILQILYVIQIATQLCAKRGKIFVIPDVGLLRSLSKSDKDNNETTPLSESFITLRKFAPLVTKLILEAEVDKRFSNGGDFHSHLSSTRPKLTAKEWTGDGSSSSVLLSLVQGAMIPLLQPNASNEESLLVQLPRFFIAIGALSGGNMLNEKAFFVSFTQTILRHKYKLPHSVRDLVSNEWLKWFKSPIGTSSMTSAVHLHFVRLLNEVSYNPNLILLFVKGCANVC